MWLILLLFLSSTSYAGDYSLDGFELREVSLNYRSYFGGGNDPVLNSSGLPDRELDKKLDITINMDVLRYLYWDNQINSTTDKDINSGSGQFRVIGWEYRIGIRIFSSLEFGLYHHSQHILDHQGVGHFPVEDALQLKLYIYKRGQSEGLFSF